MRPAVLVVLGLLAVALAAMLSAQALALLRERKGVTQQVATAQIDEIARTVALRTEYQVLTPLATALGRALANGNGTTRVSSAAQFALRVQQTFATCACVAPRGLAMHIQGATRPRVTTNRPAGDSAGASLVRWIADTLPRQALLSHLASANLIGRGEQGSGRIVFGFLTPLPPEPVGLIGYAAHIAPADSLDDVFAVALDPEAFLARALADSTVNPGTDTGVLAFRPSQVTLDVRDAAGRGLYLGSGPRWHPGVRSRTLPADLGGIDLRIYAAHQPGWAATPSGRGLVLVVVLFGMTVMLSVLAVLQLRGEHELGRRRARFVSGVSHELRTPLTQIRLFAELLRDSQPAVQAKRYEYARIIDEEAQRLTYLVDNVLAFSALENAAVTVRRRRVSLSDVIRDTVERFAPLATSRSAEIRTIIPDGVIIAADADALRRILLNILDNAVKYGPTGQTICIVLAVAGGMAQLTIDDAGPGIPAADRVRVFEPFVRLDDGRGPGDGLGGSGIGLAIVHELVAALGGAATLADAPSGGTRVRLTFPLAV